MEMPAWLKTLAECLTCSLTAMGDRAVRPLCEFWCDLSFFGMQVVPFLPLDAFRRYMGNCSPTNPLIDSLRLLITTTVSACS
jgi:hypothetical protein